jgi:hypothetical protein
MKYLAMFSLTIVALVSLSITQNIARHVNPDELREDYPNIVELPSVYAIVMDKASRENFGDALRNLNVSMRIHVPRDIRYIYDRFNELLWSVLDKLNSTKKYIDVTELNILLGLPEYGRGNLSQASYTLGEANLTYIELGRTVDEFERMLRIPGKQLAVKLTPIEKLLTKYLDEIRELRAKLESIRETGLEETKILVWVDRASVWVGEPIKLNGYLRRGGGLPLDGRPVHIQIDGRTVPLTTDSKGLFTTSLSTEGIYKPFLQAYAEYIPSGDDVGRYKASKSDVITLQIFYDKPTIHAELSHGKAQPGQVVKVYGWVNTSLGRLPEIIYMDAFSTTINRNLREDGRFNFTLKLPEKIEEGSYRIKLYTKATGAIAPSEAVLTVVVEKLPIDVIYMAPAIALSGGEITVRGRVTTSAGMITVPIPDSRVTITGFGNQSTGYSDGEGEFTVSLHVPLSALTGYSRVSLSVEPRSQLYRSQTLSIETFIVNPWVMMAPSIAFAVALVYAAPLVREVRGGATSRKRPGALVEVYALEESAPAFFYTEAVSIVGDATDIYIRDYETIREYLVRVRSPLGEAYRIFAGISMLAERELYAGEQANRMIVSHLMRKLRENVSKK